MRSSVRILLGVLILALWSGTALAYEAWGWEEIRACLLDGAGEEFIVPVAWTPPPGSELEQVVAAANYVASLLTWTPDPVPPGDVWTAADQIGTTGDCEEFAILLCSLMRFSIGIPPSRVWVQGGLIADPWAAPEYTPPIF
ncbi:MAG: transglutaminase domain-containing protein, partial [Clostridia bacterium]|nr:transglutaminase domain-containing protein [Clostridia bacterium]